LKKYRRIEVNAFRRRVTIVSGVWPSDTSDVLPAQTDDGISLNDADACEPVAPDSPEGQLILAEAIRSLERRLSPEARATICRGHNALGLNSSNRDGLLSKLQSIYQFVRPRALGSARKEK